MEAMSRNANMKQERVSNIKLNSRNAVSDDPTQQSQADRRVVRSQYLHMRNLINENRDDLTRGDSNKFSGIINEVEALHQMVRKPREQVADAEALLDLASTLACSVRSHAAKGVSPSDFVSCLLRNFGRQHKIKGTSSLWKDIGVIVSPIFRNARGCFTMLGPLETELKHRKVAVSRKRTRPTEDTQPEEIDDSMAEEKTDTDKNMSIMFEILRVKRSVKLESLALNRKSFAQTVENLFALSFLAKDGRVEILVDEKGSHLVSPRNAPAANLVLSHEVTFFHFVFRFDFKDWKSMMNLVPIGEELMPHRSLSNVSGRGSRIERVLNKSQSQSQSPMTSIKKMTRNLPHKTKKMTRNRGIFVPNQSVIEEMSDGITGIRNCKRKLW